MTRIIAGHLAPDWDCITALWLLQRFGGFEDATIALVNTGTPDPAILAEAAAVVDTGRVYDPYCWRFDHHQLDGAMVNETCATQQLYYWLATQHDLVYLAPLIDLIYAGDTGKPDANPSRQLGIHALLSSWKARRIIDDLHIIDRGYDVLDDLAEHLLRTHEAAASLDAHTVYRSADGLLIALDGAAQGATFAAFEAGARLVVWHSPSEATVSVGLNRAPESGVDCGALVDAAIERLPARLDECIELATWYRHSSGFFAGRGTAKAPDLTPLRVPFVNIAAALDAAWVR